MTSIEQLPCLLTTSRVRHDEFDEFVEESSYCRMKHTTKNCPQRKPHQCQNNQYFILKRKKRIHLLNCYVILSIFATYISFHLSSSRILSLAMQLNSNNNNDVMPQQYQHNNILYFEVPEGAPNNTWVGNIRSSDGQPPYLVVPLPQTPESERKAALNINFNNGDLTTNSILDREHRDQYHFIAIVREPFAEIKCTVTVKDINDNPPMFLMPTPNETNFVIDMPEGQRGTRKVLPLAVDFDTPQFGIKEFRIVSGNTPSGMFQLVEHEAPARSTLLQGNPDDSSTSAAMLGADNPQLMQQLAQQATVLIPSQPVMQATPTSMASTVAGGASGSSNSNGVPQSSSSLISSQSTTGGINYSIGMAASSQQQQQAIAATQSKFLIDLEVSQPLDRENQSSYQLVVEAIDGGQPPGRLMVTVNVQDINDNDPVFSRKFYECHFREDTPKGTLIYRVQAYDADLDSNGQVSYYIKRYSSSSQTATVLNQITNSTSDNNEVSARYNTASAGGSSGSGNNSKQRSQQAAGAATSGATAVASKQNRQGSNLESFENSASISPSSSSANSGDGFGFNKQRQAAYPSDQLFDIDPNKGEIYLVNSLDFETDQVHEIVVEARDHGKPYRSGYTTVKLYVIDINDDLVPSAMNRVVEDRKQMSTSANLLAGESTSRADPSSMSARLGGNEFGDILSQQGINLQNINLNYLFGQLNGLVLFGIVFVAILAVMFPVFLVKIKSRQPESDYNDTAGLTMASNNGQSKPSPNHSASNLEHPGALDGIHHRHHDHHQRRQPNGSFGGLGGGQIPFGSPNGKISSRHQCISDNLYQNPLAEPRQRHHSSTSHHMVHDSLADHQMALGQASRGGTLTLHSHRHHQLIAEHPLDHHNHSQFALPNHNTTSSLTYAHHHSRTPLLHQSNLHQSSHHLASMHQVNHNKGGTMNSIGTHRAPSASPATPNTSSSQLPTNLLDASHPHSHHQHLHPHHHHGVHHQHNQLLPSLPPIHHQQIGGLPTPPSHDGSPPGAAFPWPSTQDDCFTTGPDGVVETPGSTMNSRSTNGGGSGGSGPGVVSQPLDRWFDLGVSAQLVYAHDWYGSYNWDYLNDWTPEYHNLMPHILERSGY